jgi:parvulin-like peptidyl-prolyl isomerase
MDEGSSGGRLARGVAFLAAAAAVFSTAGTSCSRTGPAVPTGSRPVAVVNGSTISIEDLAIELNIARGPREGAAPMGDDSARRLRADVLERIIERRLVLDAARGKVQVTHEEVMQELSEMRAGYSEDQFNQAMVGSFLTQETLAARVRDRLIADRFFQKTVFGGLSVPPEETEGYVRAHAEEMIRPEKAGVLHIVVKTEDEIVQALERIKAGEDFRTVCARYSEGPEAKRGCALPPFARGRMPKVFEAAFQLEEGRMSEVLASPYGYHLLKLVKKHPGGSMPADEAAAAAGLAILEQRKREARDAWLQKARASATIRIDQKLLDSMP